MIGLQVPRLESSSQLLRWADTLVQTLRAGVPSIDGGVLTKPLITSDQNNYPLQGASLFRLSTDAARTITGFANGTPGRVVFIANVGSNNLILANESASSSAENRIITGTGGSLVISANMTAILTYDGISKRWRVTATGTAGGAGGTVTSVAGGVGITNTPEPIVGAGTVDLDINSLTTETSLASGDLFAFVDVSVGVTPSSQRKATLGNMAAGLNGLLDHGALTGLGDDDHTQYALRAGRPAATNDVTLSTDGTGTLYGSAAANAGLHLIGSSDTTSTLSSIELRAKSVRIAPNTAETDVTLMLANASGIINGLRTDPTQVVSVTYTLPISPSVAGFLRHDGVGALTWTASVVSIAGGVGITNSPEPITSTGTVDLDINSLTTETTLASGDLFAFVDVSVGTTPASQRKVTLSNLAAGVNSLIDHGGLAGLADDDHSQYTLRAGRTGTTNDTTLSTDSSGTMSGSSTTAMSLILRPNTADFTTGDIQLNGLVTLWPSFANPSAASTVRLVRYNRTLTETASHTEYGWDWSPTYTYGSGSDVVIVTSVLHVGGTIDVNFGTSNLIRAVLVDTVTTCDSEFNLPAATQLFAAQPTIQCSVDADAVGSLPSCFTLLNRLTFQTMVASSSLTVSEVYSIKDFPSLIAAASSSVTILTRRGLWFSNPSQSGSGTKSITNNIAVDVENQTLGTTIAVAVRSAMTAGSVKRFLESTGDAISTILGNITVGTNTPGSEKFNVLGNLYLDNSGTAAKLMLREPSASGSNVSTFAAQAQAGDINYTLPAALTASGFMKTDSGGSLSWALLVDGDIPDTLTLTNITGGTTFSAGIVVTTTVTSYNGDTTAGNGVASVVGNDLKTAQSAAIGTTTLFTPNTTGLYRISFYLLTTTAGNAVTVNIQFGWTDDQGARSFTSGGSIAINTAGSYLSNAPSGTFPYAFRATAGNAITYNTNISGALGAGRYLAHVVVERIA